MQPTLQTARLTLRPCDHADLDLLHEHWTTPGVRHYLWDGRTIATDTVREFIQSSQQSSYKHGYGLWILHRKRDGMFQGVCGLRDGALSWPEMLYSVPAAYWGEGIATESARCVLRHAFRTCGLAYVAATVDKPNVASIRVLERLGFTVIDEQAIQHSSILYYGLAPRQFDALQGKH